MARNDGIDRTFARNQDLPTLDDVAKVQEHNEREKDSYSNQDIDTTQTYRNIHFKAPTDSYAAMFDQMIADGDYLHPWPESRCGEIRGTDFRCELRLLPQPRWIRVCQAILHRRIQSCRRDRGR